DNEKDADISDRREQDGSLDRREITQLRGVDRVETDPGPAKHLLDEEVAAEEVAADDPRGRDDGRSRDGQDTREVETKTGVAVRPRGKNEVFRPDGSNGRASHAAQRGYRHEGEGDAGQREVRERALDHVPAPVEKA